MKKSVISIITIFILFSLDGQNFKFGKVSKAEVAESVHPLDSSAFGAILYKKERVSFYFNATEFNFMQQREVHERIKIYNKDGFDLATEKIFLYDVKGNSNERVSSLKGYTYNLVDGKVVKSKLGREGKFEERYNQSLVVNTMTMPDVKEGSVIEFQYKIMSPFIVIDDFSLQYNIPINELEVIVETPEYFKFRTQVNPKSMFQPKLNISAKNANLPTDRIRREMRDYNVDVVKIRESNIPAIRGEAYSGSINNYRSTLGFELTATFDLDKVVDNSYSSSWDRVSRSINQNNDFGGQLSRFSFYKNDVASVTAAAANDFEKALFVEDLVKSKVKWNGNYGKFAQKGIRTAYNDGQGNVADINLMVVSMLRSIGITANPVLISTRDNGIPLFPTQNGFNYVVCMVQSGNQYMLVDATEPYSFNNVLPPRVLNWKGRLVEESGASRWVNIMPTEKSSEITMLNVSMDEDLILTGKVNKNLTDYIALRYRQSYNALALDDEIKRLENDKGDIRISELTIENKKKISEPIQLSYNYELMDGVDEVGDKLYFKPMLFLAAKENPFKLEERNYPIDFVIPYEDKYVVNIKIPEGYAVESLPTSEALAFNEEVALFSYMLQQSGSYLQLKVELAINYPIINSSDYKAFKAFFNKIVEKQAEQIVLTKA